MHHKSRRTFTARLVLGTALVLVPLAGYPLGLGKLKVRSALNEPLRAEIEFTSITAAELKGLSTTLASRADFEAAGAERLPFLSQIKFVVVHRPDGRYVLELKTDQAVQEPFLHVLLQLEWPGGRLVREYSALIDPPHYVAGKPSGIESPKIVSGAEPEPIPLEPLQGEPPAPAPVAAAPTVALDPPSQTPIAPSPEPKAAAVSPPASQVPAPAAAESAPAVAPVERETFGPDQRQEVVIASDSGWPDEEAPPKIEPLEPRAPEPTQLPTPPTVADTAPASIPTPPTDDYTVKKGDTLWTIAERARAADKDITIEQLSLAFFQHNRDAFFGNNLNNLRAGKVLKMPEREQAMTVSAADARRAFKAQYDSWQEYKLKLASASGGLKVASSAPAEAAAAPAPAPVPPPVEPAAPVKPEARVTAGPEDRSKQPDELLRIVRSTLSGQKTTPDKKSAQGETPKDAARTEQTALAERASTLDESLESKQLEQKELRDKLGQVQSQIKNESRLLELENQGLAKAQTQATSPSAKAEPPAPAAKSDAPKTESTTPEAVALEAPRPAPATPVPSAETNKPEQAPKRPAVPAPVTEEKGFVASLIDDVTSGSLLPIIGGVLVLAGGAILLVYMRRRQRSIAEFEESILASDAVATDSAAASDTTGQAVTTGDTSFLSDFSQGGMGNVHTDEVDPVAEAEVYLAYGRDETAEEILKEAVVKNPERQELKLKLLEIYHQRNDVAAFETLAEELYAALAGRGGKVWDKVEEMGRKLNPENPMFRGGAPGARRAGDQRNTAPVAPATKAAIAAGAGVAATTAVAAAPVDTSMLDANFDFDAGNSGAPSAGANAGDSFNLDFGQDTMAPTAAVDFVPNTSTTSDGQSDAGLDGLDLDRAFADNVVEFSGAPSNAASEDLGTATAAEDEIKWDLDAPVAEPAAAPSASTGDQQHWDETATKLDLAKAYIDMGDSEGARSILDEVLAEGTEDQKKQAAQLASQIA